MPPNPDAAPCQCRCRSKSQFRSSTALALALGVGAMSLGGAVMVVGFTAPSVAYACAACDPCAPMDCAACDPCAPMDCAACDPCAPMDCAACDPCAADPCAACDPCAAGGGEATGCYVPRLQEAAANACAADPCGPCAPDACDPCAANACAACDPCAPMDCAACDPCAPMDCAACDPCAPMECAACDPCAPCGACGPCGPCGAAAPPPDVTEEELQALYDCMIEMTEAMDATGEAQLMLASWSESDREEGSAFLGWTNFASTPYISFTHGERFATNHANEIAAEVYGLYEDIEEMPVGGIVAKPTFSIGADGQAYWETLFLMEKAGAGASPDTNDWIYTAIMPDGGLMGRTLGENSDGMYFCAACHMAGGEDTDDLLFMEEQYRVQN